LAPGGLDSRRCAVPAPWPGRAGCRSGRQPPAASIGPRKPRLLFFDLYLRHSNAPWTNGLHAGSTPDDNCGFPRVGPSSPMSAMQGQLGLRLSTSGLDIKVKSRPNDLEQQHPASQRLEQEPGSACRDRTCSQARRPPGRRSRTNPSAAATRSCPKLGRPIETRKIDSHSRGVL